MPQFQKHPDARVIEFPDDTIMDTYYELIGDARFLFSRVSGFQCGIPREKNSLALVIEPFIVREGSSLFCVDVRLFNATNKMVGYSQEWVESIVYQCGADCNQGTPKQLNGRLKASYGPFSVGREYVFVNPGGICTHYSPTPPHEAPDAEDDWSEDLLLTAGNKSSQREAWKY